MSLDDHKTLVRRAIEAFNARDVRAADIYNEDFAREVQQYLDNMPWSDHQVDIIDLIAEGDRVVAVISTRGVQSGEYQGMPPTGKHFTNKGAAVFRIQGGRVAEMATYLDSLTVVKQLGGTVVAPAESG
jgi:predicted ester cyclase